MKIVVSMLNMLLQLSMASMVAGKTICPLRPCLDPCPEGTCNPGATCNTKPDESVPGCPGCPIFTGCSIDLDDFFVCPLIACIDPCPEEKCNLGETCLTETTELIPGCPGCETFVKCCNPAAKDGCIKTICPLIKCIDPCFEKCKPDEICVTKPTEISPGCPGCDTFVKCKPKPTQRPSMNLGY